MMMHHHDRHRARGVHIARMVGATVVVIIIICVHVNVEYCGCSCLSSLFLPYILLIDERAMAIC